MDWPFCLFGQTSRKNTKKPRWPRRRMPRIFVFAFDLFSAASAIRGWRGSPVPWPGLKIEKCGWSPFFLFSKKPGCQRRRMPRIFIFDFGCQTHEKTRKNPVADVEECRVFSFLILTFLDRPNASPSVRGRNRVENLKKPKKAV